MVAESTNPFAKLLSWILAHETKMPQLMTMSLQTMSSIIQEKYTPEGAREHPNSYIVEGVLTTTTEGQILQYHILKR
jgi:hypothetical protein